MYCNVVLFNKLIKLSDDFITGTMWESIGILGGHESIFGSLRMQGMI